MNNINILKLLLTRKIGGVHLVYLKQYKIKHKLCQMMCPSYIELEDNFCVWNKNNINRTYTILHTNQTTLQRYTILSENYSRQDLLLQRQFLKKHFI